MPDLGLNERQLPNLERNERQLPNLGRNERQLPNLRRNERQLPNLGSNERQLPNLGRNERQLPNLGSNKRQLPDLRNNERQLPMNQERAGRPVAYNPNDVAAMGAGVPAASVVQVGAIANATGMQQIRGPLMQTGLVYNRQLGNVLTLNQLSQLNTNMLARTGNVNQAAQNMLNSTQSSGNVNQMAQNVLNSTGSLGNVNQMAQNVLNSTGNLGNVNQISQNTLNSTGRLENANQISQNTLNSTGRLGNLNQISQNTLNRANMIGRINSQGITTILRPQGRINYRQSGQSNIYGNVNKARLLNGTVRTDNIQIKGFSKVEAIIAKNFTDPSGKMAAIRKGSDRYLLINGGPNIGVSLNDAFIQKNRQYNLQSERYFLNQDQQLMMLGLKNVYMNPKNSGLNSSQKFKLYALNRITENDRLLSSGSDNYMRDRDAERPDYENWYRNALESLPNMNVNDIKDIVRRAKQLKEIARRQNQMLAAGKTDMRMNLRNENESALDNLLKETSVISADFNNYIENRFQDDEIHTLSDNEIHEIEKQARENVEAREDIPLEDKEKEYQEELEKLREEKKEEKFEEAQKIVKDEILDNPDAAKEILGEEATEELKKEFEKNRRKKESIYDRILERQEQSKDERFVKKYPKYKKSSSYEIHKARVDEEMKTYIRTAANQVDLKNNKNSKIRNFEDYNNARNIRYNTNMLKAE